MKFNPDIHHRSSIRLREYDYRSAGAYFVTICSFQREYLFGEVVDVEMRLTDAGVAAVECWQGIPDHFPQVQLDEFVVMPNHIHGIILLDDFVGARHASPGFETQTQSTDPQTRATHASPLRDSRPGPKPRSIGSILGAYKSAVTKRINTLRDNPGCPVWQRNYYEHVVRNETDLANIRQYIANNPLKWDLDENNPANAGA
jgi:REP-associated tyrosine transposase